MVWIACASSVMNTSFLADFTLSQHVFPLVTVRSMEPHLTPNDNDTDAIAVIARLVVEQVEESADKEDNDDREDSAQRERESQRQTR